jgi:hypothetical protein
MPNGGTRDHLTEPEVERLMEAAMGGRYVAGILR